MLDSDFNILKGTPSVVNPPQQFGVAEKHFCNQCGCNIYGTHTYLRGMVLPATGTFNDTDWFSPDAHIFVRSKQPWVAITDNKPQFDMLYNREEVWPEKSLKRLQAHLAAK